MSLKKLLLTVCLILFPSIAFAQSMGPISDTLSGKYNFMYTGSHTLFYNGTYFQRWTGSIMSTEATVNTGYAPHVKSFLSGYDATAGSWKWINTIDTQADAQVTTLNGLVTSSLLYGYNGASFDLLRVGASNELNVVDVSNRAGEDIANDYRKVKIDAIATDGPAFTDTNIVGGAGLTVALASLEVIGWEKVCMYFYNSGANAFTDVSIEASADNTNFTADLGFTSCDTAAIGVTCVYCFSDALRYVRARVSSAANTSVRAWFTMKK